MGRQSKEQLEAKIAEQETTIKNYTEEVRLMQQTISRLENEAREREIKLTNLKNYASELSAKVIHQ